MTMPQEDIAIQKQKNVHLNGMHALKKTISLPTFNKLYFFRGEELQTCLSEPLGSTVVRYVLFNYCWIITLSAVNGMCVQS